MKRNRFALFSPGLYVETLRQLRLMGGIYLVLCVAFTLIPNLLSSFQSQSQPGISEFAPSLFLFIYIAPLTLVCTAFGYLTRRNASDFYHSLPLTRNCLYITRVLAVLTYLVGTILLSLLSACLAYALCGRPYNPAYLPDQFLYFTTCAVLVMGCSLIGITVTGTQFSAFVVTGIVLFLPRLISVAVAGMVESVAPLVYPKELGPLFNYNLNLPASAVAGVLSLGTLGTLSPNEFMRYGAGMLYTGVLGILYVVLGGVFHRTRASETAGKSAPNRVLQHVYRCAISLPLFLVLGVFLSLEDWNVRVYNALFFWPLFVLALAIYFIYELITTKKVRNLLSALCVLPVVLALGFGLPPLARIAGEHLLHTVPAEEDVTSVQIAVDPNGSLRNYAEIQLSEISSTDEELLSLTTHALESTVAYYDDTDKYVGARQPLGVRFHLRSGGSLTRRVLFLETDLARLSEILTSDEAYRSALTRLPQPEEILSVDGPGWKQQDDSEFFALYREEYAALSPEDQLSLALSIPSFARSEESAAIPEAGGMVFSLSGVADGESFYASYGITEKTPKSLLLAMQRVNEESGFATSSAEETTDSQTAEQADAYAEEVLPQQALEQTEEMLRNPSPDAQLWVEGDFLVYEPGADGRILSIKLNLSDAAPTDSDVTAEYAPEALPDVLELLDLLQSCSTQIDSLDEPIVGLSYFLTQDYNMGTGVSVGTVYFRMTQAQFDRFLALTAPYVQ